MNWRPELRVVTVDCSLPGAIMEGNTAWRVELEEWSAPFLPGEDVALIDAEGWRIEGTVVNIAPPQGDQPMRAVVHGIPQEDDGPLIALRGIVDLVNRTWEPADD